MSTERDERSLRLLADAYGEVVRKSRSARGYQWGTGYARYLIIDSSTRLPVAAGDCPRELLERYKPSDLERDQH